MPESEYPIIEVLDSSDTAVVKGHNMFTENRRAFVIAIQHGVTPEELMESAYEFFKGALAFPTIDGGGPGEQA